MAETTLIQESSSTMAARHFAWRLRFETDPYDVNARLRTDPSDLVLVDTRPAEQFHRGHLPNAVSLPLADMSEQSLALLDRSKSYVTYSDDPGCNGATKGAMKMAAAGLSVQEMLGGIEYWLRAGYPTTDEGAVPALSR